MKSYLNNPELKKRFVEEIKKHKEADSIIQGTYGEVNEEWKGCAVSCSLRSLDIIEGKELKTEYKNHKDYETKLGIPEWLARLEDTLFERMEAKDAKKFPLKFAEAIPVGVDLKPVKYKFGAYLMQENINTVLSLDIEQDLKNTVISAITEVLKLHQKAIKTGIWDSPAADLAAHSAYLVADSAHSISHSVYLVAHSAHSIAHSIAYLVAHSAAYSAADSGHSAVHLVLCLAINSAAHLVEHSAETKKYSDKLINLLKKS